jgi:ABC-type multidrug transport system fused ATPase/permease subunit
MQPVKNKTVKVSDASSNAGSVQQQLEPVVDDVEANTKPVRPTSQMRQLSQGLQGSQSATKEGWVSKSISAGSNAASVSIPRLQSISYSLMAGNIGGASVNGSRSAVDKDRLGVDEWKPEVALNVEYYKSKTNSVAQARGCRVLFRNLFYSVPNPKDKNTGITLLNNVTGMVSPGEMCALMGASGAGKSTLLDVLAGRKTVGTISGDLLFNGAVRSPTVMKSVAYVMQDNVHIGSLTVRQTLYYAAELRLDEHMNRSEKDERINQVLHMLGLDHVADTM